MVTRNHWCHKNMQLMNLGIVQMIVEKYSFECQRKKNKDEINLFNIISTYGCRVGITSFIYAFQFVFYITYCQITLLFVSLALKLMQHLWPLESCSLLIKGRTPLSNPTPYINLVGFYSIAPLLAFTFLLILIIYVNSFML